GINPSLYSAAVGHHFARPGNRFWPALHLCGLTPRRLAPTEDHGLLAWGMGLTNLVARATARADELDARELREGAAILRKKVTRCRPDWVAVVGVTAYREAFEEPRAMIGEQTRRLGTASLWILPNPSGLNAHYQLPRLAEEFAALKARAGY